MVIVVTRVVVMTRMVVAARIVVVTKNEGDSKLTVSALYIVGSDIVASSLLLV